MFIKLLLLAACYLALTEWGKHAFGTEGWGTRTLGFIASIILSITFGVISHWGIWAVIRLIFGLWLLPAGFFLLFKHEIIPWFGWLISQIVPPRSNQYKDRL